MKILNISNFQSVNKDNNMNTKQTLKSVFLNKKNRPYKETVFKLLKEKLFLNDNRCS
jgi:hypothetical protein